MNKKEGNEKTTTRITTLIFDVDDTLYDVGTGFTKHIAKDGTPHFMVSKLYFPDIESARKLRNEYFQRFNSISKGLTMAEQEGKFPPLPKEIKQQYEDQGVEQPNPRFHPNDIAHWWATKLNFDLLGGPNKSFINDLKQCPLSLVAFSNGPREYIERVLDEIGLSEIFGDSNLFTVDDVLPYCKPEKEAFQLVLNKIGVSSPNQCIMIEDSIKNIRAAKALGMKTILVTGRTDYESSNVNEANDTKNSSNTNECDLNDTKISSSLDPVEAKDPSVDIIIESVVDLRTVLPGLWEIPSIFDSKQLAEK